MEESDLIDDSKINEPNIAIILDLQEEEYKNIELKKRELKQILGYSLKNLYISDIKAFLNQTNGIVLRFEGYQYSMLLPPLSAMSLNMIDIIVKTEMQTNIIEFDGKKIITIDINLYESFSLNILNQLYVILSTGYVGYGPIHSDTVRLIDVFGGLHPTRISGQERLPGTPSTYVSGVQLNEVRLASSPTTCY